MSKQHLKLQPSESVVIQAAAQIYAAYIAAGRVEQGQEPQWMQRSIQEAMMIAQATDDAIISDEEIDASELQDRGGIIAGRNRQQRSRHDA
jgi:hypothetical protein